MAYTIAEGRQQIFAALVGAAEELGVAVAELSEAYERLDDQAAERLEETVFGPAQLAYGRAKRTYREFAERSGSPGHDFQTPSQVAPSGSSRQLIERAVAALARADLELGELQDSMLPVEVGDAELRAGLAEVRTLSEQARPAARELVRTLGR